MKFFGKEHDEVDPNNYEFVYVTFEPAEHGKDEETGLVWCPNFLGTFSWGVKGIGFGTIDVSQMSAKTDQAFFNTEQMSKNFIKQMLNYWVENGVTDRDSKLRPEHNGSWGPKNKSIYDSD